MMMEGAVAGERNDFSDVFLGGYTRYLCGCSVQE